MVVAFEEYYLFSVSVRSCGHYGEGCNVVSVFREECPVCACNSVDKKLREVYHNSRGGCYNVSLFSLLCCGFFYVRVVVAENVRTVRAHIVDVPVSVNVPEVAAMRSRRKLRERLDGNEAALSRAEMTVNSRRDYFSRTHKFLA